MRIENGGQPSEVRSQRSGGRNIQHSSVFAKATTRQDIQRSTLKGRRCFPAGPENHRILNRRSPRKQRTAGRGSHFVNFVCFCKNSGNFRVPLPPFPPGAVRGNAGCACCALAAQFVFVLVNSPQNPPPFGFRSSDFGFRHRFMPRPFVSAFPLFRFPLFPPNSCLFVSIRGSISSVFVRVVRG